MMLTFTFLNTHNTTRITNNNSIVRDREINHGMCSDNNIISYGNTPKNNTTTANPYIIPNSGDAWIFRIATTNRN